MKTQGPRRVLIALAENRSSNCSFLQGVALYVRLHTDWRIEFIDTYGQDEHAITNRLLPLVGRLDGVICKEDQIPVIRRHLPLENIPLAIFGSPTEGVPPSRTVYFSIRGTQIGSDAAKYFQQLGNFAAYGFYASNKPHTFIQQRAEGFSAELKTMGILPSLSFSYEHPEETLRWIKSLPRPSAIFCACDLYAVRLLDICRDNGIHVPRQVSILGADNDETISLFAQPALSSLQLPHEELGFAAATALDNLMKSRRLRRPTSVELSESRIIERDSTAAPVPAAHLIQNALVFIRQNASSPLRVDDVARHLGVSRKLLERRFREMGEVPIHETILRRRLEHLRHELQLSAKPIHVITASCGFDNPTWIKTLFRQRFGLTMSEFRQRSPMGDHKPQCLP